MHIVIINGPNLNLLGTRAPEIYGSTTLQDVEEMCTRWAEEVGATITAYQSNHEGDLIDRLQRSSSVDGIVINPGAFTHYSYAIRDAIEAIPVPTVEVHISNIHDREPWRRTSVVSDVCVATIFGRGVDGYRDAIRHIAARAAWPAETIPYGPARDEVADLRVPPTAGPHPVVVLIHGGFWRETVGRDLLDGIAIDLTRRGWATWNIEYPRIGSGGNRVTTPAAVETAIRSLAAIAEDRNLDLSRMIVIGCGSGGYLAIRSAAEEHEPRFRALVGLAPIGDLEAADHAAVGDGAVAAFMQGPSGDESERYAAPSSDETLPLGIPLLVVHGDRDDRIPVELSRSFVGRAADLGDTVVYHEFEGVGHDVLIDPESTAWQTVADEIDRFRR